MKRFYFPLILGLLCPLFPLHAEIPVPGTASVPQRSFHADVVLEAVPIRVKPLEKGKKVDALEKSPEEMGSASVVVVFRINRVMRGTFETTRKNDPSLWEQAKDAADNKNILKLVTMDFERPEESPTQKTFFSMAVTDPRLFETSGGGALRKQRYKISLALLHKNPDSYVLVKSEKL